LRLVRRLLKASRRVCRSFSESSAPGGSSTLVFARLEARRWPTSAEVACQHRSVSARHRTGRWHGRIRAI